MINIFGIICFLMSHKILPISKSGAVWHDHVPFPAMIHTTYFKLVYCIDLSMISIRREQAIEERDTEYARHCTWDIAGKAY